MKFIERLIDKYFCIKTIVALLKEDFESYNVFQLNKINCFAFHGGDLKLLRIRTGYDDNWKAFEDLINRMIIIEKYQEVEKFNIGLIKSISCSKSNNIGNYFYNIDIRNAHIKPKDILYLFGFNNYKTSEKKSEWELQACLEHSINNEVLRFTYYKWNDWYEWNNSNGSHHLATALYHLRNANEKFYIKALVENQELNREVISELIEKYEIFMSHEKNAWKFFSLLDTPILGRHMKIFYIVGQNNLRLIVFEKAYFEKDCTGQIILKILNKMDSRYFFGWNDKLKEYLNK
ncbi:hypothetical protein BGG39_06460 [Campylobacter lari]|nr:hypothetical protein [Campylobacter lari]